MIRRTLTLLAASLTAFLLSNCSTAPASAGAAGLSPGTATFSHSDGAARNGKPLKSSPPKDRPGLSTDWGHTIDDKVGTTIFEREPGKPLAIAKIFYNDQAGATAMAGQNYSYSTSFRDYVGGIFRTGLRNHRGAALTAYQAGDNLICIGESGQRYTIEVENLSNHRLEFVVTVDGLDVLTGNAGSFGSRGYVLDPGERREIKGWRTSVNEVAGFKFGAVPDGYASQKTGDTRNVGVIGAAVFAERGTTPKPFAGTDSYRRLRADPFVVKPAEGFAKPVH